jgi:hypothetical protein
MNPMTLPIDHLTRVFGRDMTRDAWTVEAPFAANDDELLRAVDPAFLMAMKKRGRR